MVRPERFELRAFLFVANEKYFRLPAVLILEGRVAHETQGVGLPPKTSLLARCCNREEEIVMEKLTRRRYTLEYKQEAVRLGLRTEDGGCCEGA